MTQSRLSPTVTPSPASGLLVTPTPFSVCEMLTEKHNFTSVCHEHSECCLEFVAAFLHLVSHHYKVAIMKLLLLLIYSFTKAAMGEILYWCIVLVIFGSTISTHLKV